MFVSGLLPCDEEAAANLAALDMHIAERWPAAQRSNDSMKNISGVTQTSKGTACRHSTGSHASTLERQVTLIAFLNELCCVKLYLNVSHSRLIMIVRLRFPHTRDNCRSND